MWRPLPLLLALTTAVPGCSEHSGALTRAQRDRFAGERIRRQAEDLPFRYTDHPGRRDARWEDRLASIVVTGATVLVHKNEKVGVEITPRTRRRAAVERSGPRVRIRVGGGRTEELWSFVPPDDPAGWTDDIRAVIRRSGSEADHR
jgi:hypothetical protein